MYSLIGKNKMLSELDRAQTGRLSFQAWFSPIRKPNSFSYSNFTERTNGLHSELGRLQNSIYIKFNLTDTQAINHLYFISIQDPNIVFTKLSN